MKPSLLIAFATLALSPAIAQGQSSAEAELQSRFTSLERRAEKVREGVARRPTDLATSQLQRSVQVWDRDPAASAAVLTAMLASGVAQSHPAHRERALIEAGRAEMMIGDPTSALDHFLQAAGIATSAHAMASAFEGYVEAAERSEHKLRLPHIDRYVTLVGKEGRLDAPGYETLYRLGRALMTRGDDRGFTVMSLIPEEVPAGRRALYVRGADLLRRGEKSEALATFERAAELPPYGANSGVDPQRDAEVIELSWFAVGRLAFEAGDPTTGFFAYQMIDLHSPRFIEAFYELGWLAIEAGQDRTARNAFEPVVELGSATEYGRKAQLLRGYIMLQKDELDEAVTHYESIARDFTTVLTRFESAVAGVEKLEDLARECDTRDWALQHEQLAPMLKRDGVRRAQVMVTQLEDLRASGFAVERKLEELDALLAGEGPNNPFVRLEKDRQAIRSVLRDVQDLAVKLGRSASAAENDSSCCTEPRLRAKKLHDELERDLHGIEKTEELLRDGVTGLRASWQNQLETYEARRAALEPELLNAQRRAVNEAIQEEREHLMRMVMEGETGTLQAIWNKKEKVRDRIGELEQTRKTEMDQLLWKWSDYLFDDDD